MTRANGTEQPAESFLCFEALIPAGGARPFLNKLIDMTGHRAKYYPVQERHIPWLMSLYFYNWFNIIGLTLFLLSDLKGNVQCYAQPAINPVIERRGTHRMTGGTVERFEPPICMQSRNSKNEKTTVDLIMQYFRDNFGCKPDASRFDLHQRMVSLRRVGAAMRPILRAKRIPRP